MKIQFDNKLISSLLLFIDHQVQKHGEAYTNHSGLLYPITSDMQSYSAYATPFKPLCNDTSIAGARVMSGIYLNGNPISVGQSGLHSINHERGTVYFSGNLPSTAVLSGNYAIKEFGVHLTDQPENKLLFETKYLTNAKYNQVLSGLPLDTKTCPALFVKAALTDNKPFALGSIDDNSMRMRVIVIADNEFQRVAICNILKNLNMKQVPIYQSLPFDRNGAFTGVSYNYDALTLDTSYLSRIMSSRVVTLAQKEGVPSMTKSTAIVDLEISTIMTHF